ncbi:MAG: cytochrome d ubiquinol oxidase subunit II [Anaerolineae bacterium]
MINDEFLQLFVYGIFVFSIVAYSTLDGFDLGVGCLHLFAKGDNERRLMINAIGPVWDGNTTWIVIGGGTLFAGFPRIFSIIMPNLYTFVMILLFALMLRGAAIEFRGKRPGKRWRSVWDVAFFSASLLLTLDIGVILGNLIQGMPLNFQGELQGTFTDLLHPYAFLIAFLALSIFMMHGSIYLLMKTEGALHDRLRIWVKRLIILFIAVWVIATGCTFVYNSHMIAPLLDKPYLAVFAIACIFCILAIPQAIKKQRDGWAFIASCFSIIFLLLLFIIGTFPRIVYSTIDPERNSLTLYNGSSGPITLLVLTIIALLGVPLAFFYSSYIYKVFKGKIKLDPMSY